MLARGLQWERRAGRLLKRAGLQPVATNFRCRSGEIDLVMRDGNCLVFVEVRYRGRRGHGSGADSVDRHKQRRLTLAASQFLSTHQQYALLPCRFDVVAIDGSGTRPKYDWIRSAFEAACDG